MEKKTLWATSIYIIKVSDIFSTYLWCNELYKNFLNSSMNIWFVEIGHKECR